MQAGDTVNLTATLKRVGGRGDHWKTLTFKVDGSVIGTATTNASGVGTVSYAAPLEVGTKAITVEYAGTEVLRIERRHGYADPDQGEDDAGGIEPICPSEPKRKPDRTATASVGSGLPRRKVRDDSGEWRDDRKAL